MSTKKGAGGKPQDYDEKTGRYGKGREPLNGSLVTDYLFGMDRSKEYPLPIFGQDDEEYAEMYVSLYLKERGIKKYFISDSKIKDYLLKPHATKNDKSNFFNHFGYNLQNWELLYKAIIDGTDFKNPIFNRYNKWGLYIHLSTSIPSLFLDKRIVNFLTSWKIEEDGYIRFITVELSH